MMSKTSSAVKDRWNKKAYDNLTIRLPKGRKETLEAYATKNNQSVNGLVNSLIRAEIGLTEAQWRRPGKTEEKVDDSSEL